MQGGADAGPEQLMASREQGAQAGPQQHRHKPLQPCMQQCYQGDQNQISDVATSNRVLHPMALVANKVTTAQAGRACTDQVTKKVTPPQPHCHRPTHLWSLLQRLPDQHLQGRRGEGG